MVGSRGRPARLFASREMDLMEGRHQRGCTKVRNPNQQSESLHFSAVGEATWHVAHRFRRKMLGCQVNCKSPTESDEIGTARLQRCFIAVGKRLIAVGFTGTVHEVSLLLQHCWKKAARTAGSSSRAVQLEKASTESCQYAPSQGDGSSSQILPRSTCSAGKA